MIAASLLGSPLLWSVECDTYQWEKTTQESRATGGAAFLSTIEPFPGMMAAVIIVSIAAAPRREMTGLRAID